jgi:hypothetical protein
MGMQYDSSVPGAHQTKLLEIQVGSQKCYSSSCRKVYSQAKKRCNWMLGKNWIIEQFNTLLLKCSTCELFQHRADGSQLDHKFVIKLAVESFVIILLFRISEVIIYNSSMKSVIQPNILSIQNSTFYHSSCNLIHLSILPFSKILLLQAFRISILQYAGTN